jgi:hypothetical protein
MPTRSTSADRVGPVDVELRGSHVVQTEQPDRVHELLLAFLARANA